MRLKKWLMASALALAFTPAGARAPAFSVVEASITDMQIALGRHRVTSRELVQQYLMRIGTYEDKFHATLSVNPNALAEADALDRERARGHIRGPLHGIPIAIKDNIHTTEMPTTGNFTSWTAKSAPSA